LLAGELRLLLVLSRRIVRKQQPAEYDEANYHAGKGGHMEFVWFILIGLAAGWLAGQLMKGGGFGVIGDIIVGVIGALLGGFIFSTLGVSVGGGLFGSLIVATIGAIVLIFLLRVAKKA
jgi:uncharacterized membrane protein YeaQ/YmgE (transglycosylase-associated protein family)